MHSPTASGAAATPLTIVLTGERRKQHFIVLIHGYPVQLTGTPLGMLIELILAGGNSGRGYVKLHPRDVHRLRFVIDEAVGPATSTALIETGPGGQYRLTVPVDSQVGITKCFYELVSVGVVTQAQANDLRGLCVEYEWNPIGIGLVAE